MTAEELRKSILQMAIQGKLVKQDPNDEPASVLLERIREEKTRLIKEGKIKWKMTDSVIYKGSDNSYYEKVGKTEVCIDDEIPFELPDGWAWTRLSAVCEMYTGDSINETEKKKKYMGHTEGRFYIGTKDVGFDHVITYDNGVRIPYEEESKFRIAPSLSTLLCVEGGSAGRKIAMLNQAVCFGNKLCCFAPHSIDETYLYYYLQSPSFISVFKSNTTGIIGGVSINTLKGLLFAIPPLSEQHRIVKKLLLLSPFIAEYNEYEQAESLLNEELPTMLRKSILQYAIQGKLVPQDPSDEPASILLERIRRERERANGGKKSKAKTESYIFKNSDDNSYYEKIGEKVVCIDEEIPFEIPNSWCWIRLASCYDIRNGFTPLRTNTDYWSNGTIPWFTVEDIRNEGTIINDTRQKINEIAVTKDRIVPANSFLLCCTASVGVFAQSKIPLTTNQQFNALTVKNDCLILLMDDYLYAIGEYFSNILHSIAGETTFEFVSVKKLGNVLLPVPPIEEQQRIIKKISIIKEIASQ